MEETEFRHRLRKRGGYHHILVEIEEKHQFHHEEIIMTMHMKKEEVIENLTMKYIEMKRDIVKEACMNEGMIMVEIDVGVLLILLKKVIELVFIIEIETKFEILIGMLKMIDVGNRV